MASSTRLVNQPRTSPFSTASAPSQTYTGRGVLPTLMGSNLPITDMNQLQLTPEGAAQRQVDLGAWNNTFMNSPVYNAGGANTYAIQNGPQDSLLSRYFANTSQASTNAPTTSMTGSATTGTSTPGSAPGLKNNLSEAGAPVYDGSFSLSRQNANNERMGTSGYLGQLSKAQAQTRGNPYNNVYPWSNWKLWSN